MDEMLAQVPLFRTLPQVELNNGRVQSKTGKMISVMEAPMRKEQPILGMLNLLFPPPEGADASDRRSP